MTRSSPAQLDLDFGQASTGNSNGHATWTSQRQESIRQLAIKLGLPIDHEVNVLLVDGVHLTGTLQLATEQLWVEQTRDLDLELRIGRCTFRVREIESCARR